MKKPLIVYGSRYLRIINRWPAAQSLGPVILFKWTREQVARSPVFRHELQHFYQYQRLGLFKFFLYYLRGLFVHGYKRHPMESGADKAEVVELTAQERAWRDGPESKLARAVDLFLTAIIPALLLVCGYAFYRWTQQ